MFFSTNFVNRAKVFIVIFVSTFVTYAMFGNLLNNKIQTNPTLYNFFRFAPKVQFGLDIVGGSQLLIAVDFDKFLDDRYQIASEEIKDLFWQKKIKYRTVLYKKEDKAISINLLEPNNSLKQTLYGLDNNFVISQKSDDTLIVQYDVVYLKELQNRITEQSMSIIQKRIDSLGTKEIVLYKHGKDQIVLQVPGVSDPAHLKRLLGKTAKLSFHLMDEKQPFLSTPPTYVEEDKDVLQGADRYIDRFYKIVKKPSLSGDSLVDARVHIENLRVMIIFRLNNQGAKKFAQITLDNVGKPFAIVLDNLVLTAPIINEPIVGGSGTISGNFSAEEAQELAQLLRSGALPTQLKIMEERIVGPSIGKIAIDSAKLAFGIGIGSLMLFMLIYYRTLGLIANVAILLNLACAITIMALFKFSITLPGIAALILTLGMSVDANVLIYERMRDELKKKKIDIKTVIKQGFEGSFSAILDSNITTILSAVTLVAIGSGFIRGFAIGLIVGLLTSLFTAITFTKMIIEAMAKSGILKKYLRIS